MYRDITTEARHSLHFLLSFAKMICQTACSLNENTALNDCLCVTRFHTFSVLFARAVKLTNDSYENMSIWEMRWARW